MCAPANKKTPNIQVMLLSFSRSSTATKARLLHRTERCWKVFLQFCMSIQLRFIDTVSLKNKKKAAPLNRWKLWAGLRFYLEMELQTYPYQFVFIYRISPNFYVKYEQISIFCYYPAVFARWSNEHEKGQILKSYDRISKPKLLCLNSRARLLRPHICSPGFTLRLSLAKMYIYIDIDVFSLLSKCINVTEPDRLFLQLDLSGAEVYNVRLAPGSLPSTQRVWV